MKFAVDRAVLLKALAHVQSVVERRNTIPILANVLLRGLLRDGRLLRLAMDIPDRPGVLADITTRIGGSGGNIIEVVHQRLFDAPSVQSAELELMIEARDPAHADQIMAALSGSYALRRS